MMGDDPQQLREDGRFLAELIKTDIEKASGCTAKFGIGSIQQRLTSVHLSFVDALAILQDSERQPAAGSIHFPDDLVQSSKLDRSALESYLRTGLISDFDAFFDATLRAISEAALHSTLIKHYLFVDIILTSAQFVAELGGKETEVIPLVTELETLLTELRTVEQIRETLRGLLAGVLAFRNEQADNDKVELIFEAKAYIKAHFADPDLHLEDVASSVNLSPSHFSTVFGRETGESFKSYLTRIRIEHAKALLRTTNLKCSEIAYQSGYNDPHYFSYAFKKNTGIPPQQFRQATGD
jgi:two-component system response regulator YesN